METTDKPKKPGLDRLTYTIRESQEVSGLSHMTIWRRMRDGQLKSTKVGRRRLIDAHSLHQLIGIAS